MNGNIVCSITGNRVDQKRARKGFTVRPSIQKLIKEVCPTFDNDSWISEIELKKFKLKYIQDSAREEGFKSEIATFVAKSVANHDFLSKTYLDTAEQPTKVQDFTNKIANFMGSWLFVRWFVYFVLIWIAGNITTRVDPYPFQFLNLVLGIMAALSAPLILMAQNREQEDDRKRAENDFKVNLKNEFELMIIREKIDHVINVQNPHIHESLKMLAQDIEELKPPPDDERRH